MSQLNTTFYETLLRVRPDDIDMFQHVHSAKYIDYVLAARYDQMERCYNNPMEDYLKQGLGWVVNSCTIHFKRPLKLKDEMVVRTRITEVRKYDVTVEFEIVHATTKKLCSNGSFQYTFIQLSDGRAKEIPDWVLQKYTLHD
ncbi:MAG: acyl-CoA thioesterase [Bacteroidota bacterium]|jgi:YbgC/YbaW family acyl-CoA thioester hydrolase